MDIIDNENKISTIENENKIVDSDEVINRIRDGTTFSTAGKQIRNMTASTAFTDKVDVVKEKILDDASKNDEKFVNEVTENVKDATIKLVEVEKEKAELEKKNIRYEQELLETKQKLNELQSIENVWENKKKNRQFHYDGVKPIMLFVGITEPMNLVILYTLTVLLTPCFLLSKLWDGTIGTLLSGAGEEDRAKTAKGFLWTLLCFFIMALIAIPTLYLLNRYGIVQMT